jgi:hypothetical protein
LFAGSVPDQEPLASQLVALVVVQVIVEVPPGVTTCGFTDTVTVGVGVVVPLVVVPPPVLVPLPPVSELVPGVASFPFAEHAASTAVNSSTAVVRTIGIGHLI